MAVERKPLSAEAQRALDLLRETGGTDWFIFDAMEAVANGGVQQPHTVLEELSRAGFGQIYDNQRRFQLGETETAVSSADFGELEVDDPEVDELEPPEELEDGVAEDWFENQELLKAVLVELLALQLMRQDGLPGDPLPAVYNRLTSGSGQQEAVTRTAVADAIAYCRRRGWLQTHHDYLALLTGRGRFLAYFLGQERFSAWKSAPAWVYHRTTEQWSFAKVPKPKVSSVPSATGGQS